MSGTNVLEQRRTDTALDGDSLSASRTGRSAHPGLLILRDFAIVVFATLVPLFVLFRLWEGDLGVPFVYFGDPNFYGGVAQNIIETGWIQHSDRLGAPFGQELYDFPLGGDNFHWLVMRALSIFTSNWAAIVNAFYLLTFFASSVSAFFCLRWLGGRRATSFAAALLFAFLPFHFIRFTHLMYASYAILPVGVVLAVRASHGGHPFSGLRGTGSRRWPAIAGWVVLTALVGSCNAYYAVFSVVIIVTAVGVTSIAERTWRPLLAGAITVVVIGSVLAVNLAPSLLHNRRNGDNEQVAERIPAEVDVYGLRVIQLLTPVPGHRVAPLATLSEDLQETPYNSEQSMFLGAVGSVALLCMFGTLLVRSLRGRGQARDDEIENRVQEQSDVRPLLTALTVVAILIATMGGLSWFLAVAGFTEIRSWNRISTLVAFLALAWLVLSVDRLLASPRLAAIGRWPIAAGAVALVLVGIADQTSAAIVPDRRDVATEFAADREYFASLEEQLPRGAAVFQLPYMPYPETPAIENMIVYDPLRPYLHTNELKWSYGGMMGRESDWQAVTGSKPANEIVDDAIAAGFSGVLVDRFGYADKGAQIAIALGNLTGDDGTESADGRWIFFDLSAPLARYETSTTPAQRDQLRAEVLAQRP